jgi:hypothetical protein
MNRRQVNAARPWYLVLWLTGAAGHCLARSRGPHGVSNHRARPGHFVGRRSDLRGGRPPLVAGQGSIALLENLLTGWKSKIFALVLLEFAATDFAITMTLSAADAARHAIANPYLHPYVGDGQINVTLVLLALLAAVLMFGFREAINLATVVDVPYLLLKVIVLIRGRWQIIVEPQLLPRGGSV